MISKAEATKAFVWIWLAEEAEPVVAGRLDQDGTGCSSPMAQAIGLAAAPDYHLKEAEAAALIENQIATIAENWQSVCGESGLSEVDRKLFAGRQFLNGYALEGLKGHAYSSAQRKLITGGDA